MRLAQEIDPATTRARLTGLARRLRRAGELGGDQAYIPRWRTKYWTREEGAVGAGFAKASYCAIIVSL